MSYNSDNFILIVGNPHNPTNLRQSQIEDVGDSTTSHANLQWESQDNQDIKKYVVSVQHENLILETVGNETSMLLPVPYRALFYRSDTFVVAFTTINMCNMYSDPTTLSITVSSSTGTVDALVYRKAGNFRF